MPTFQNPTGACMPARRRHEVLELARAYEIPVVEDDFVADLRYDGSTQPALKALDHSGGVIYVGTLSKLLMPGVRIGFVVADGPILGHLGGLKRAIDLSTSPFMQQVVDRYVTVGRYQTHLRRSIRVYRARRDTLLAALARELPAVSTTSPRGGLFAWVTLPDGASSSGLRQAAIRRGVNFAPGSQFFSDPADGERHLRLNFAVHAPQQIDDGVRRLAAALADTRSTGTPG
jgi:GntR family transcriptional regulator/MocR family aminotransferase